MRKNTKMEKYGMENG